MKNTVLFTALGLAAVAAHAQQIGQDAQPFSNPEYRQSQPQYPYQQPLYQQPPYQPQAQYQQPQPQYQQPQPQAQYQQPQYQPAPTDSGRVISSTPVVQQVAVPRQVCSQQPMVVQGPRSTSGAGSIIGAIAGGLLGNTIGHGGGRAAATALGVMGGALVGNSVEANGSPAYAQNVQQCTTQTTYENRTVAYNVTYEYAGRQYTVQMPQDPGPTVQLQVTPLAAATPEPVYSGSVSPVEGVPILRSVDGVPPPVVYAAPQVYPVPVVVPAYGYRPYYPPLGISLNLGYSRGYGYGHRHRHWR